ncbi:F-box domain-containing protein [Favolaschia claudopus]|uniref:inorganic diphosphatase n=1 Tax=Favolaschia claudopus TaxID=2862362 RepID=A0AAW0EH46_9AGAR
MVLLPTELYSAIIEQLTPDGRQQTILALMRALPYAPIRLEYLFEQIVLTHADQALQLTRRLLKPDGPTLCAVIREFSLQDEWTVDAEVIVNMLRKLPNLRLLSLCVGTNFAPEHLVAVFAKPRPELQYLSLRLRPYVRKATYQQFLSGSYFDSTLSCLADWPVSDLPTLSIIQEPMDPALTQKLAFAQPLVFHIAGPLTASPLSLPNVELLDLSTCNVFGAELTDTILARLRVKHLILDNGALLRGEYHAEDWAVLGRGCALAGVKRTKEREKKLRQARLETVPVPTQERRPRKGRRGVSTATISLRASPPRDSRVVGVINTPAAAAMRKIRLYPAAPILRSFATTLPPSVTPDKHAEIREQFEKGWLDGLRQLQDLRARLYQSYRLGTTIMKFGDPEESIGTDEGLDGLVEVDDWEENLILKSASDSSSSAWRMPVQKVASYIRFRTQGQGQTNKRPPIVFPPPSWSLEDTLNNGAGASDLPNEPGIPKNFSEDGVAPEDVPEPRQFAQRISTLINELPPPAPTQEGEVGAVDPKGPPLPSSVTADSKLMKLLSSENVMNGSLSLGRQSVWYILDRLNHRQTAVNNAVNKDKGADREEHDKEDTGVMMYAPLQPKADSQVELADSELVLEYMDDPLEAGPPPPSDEAVQDAPQPPTSLPQEGGKPGILERSKSKLKGKGKEHVHWVPSQTQLSVQAMWWGYRIYFPPPVMDLLDDTHLEAAKRGAMITAALKYLLDKIPTAMFPPQMRPAVMMSKRLTPYLGYVGVFIAWSWTAIKARDKGHGVVLTATWLLPVALVPGTLEPKDYLRPGEVQPTTAAAADTMSLAPDNVEATKDAASVPAETSKADATLEEGSKNSQGDGAKPSTEKDPEEHKEPLARRWNTLILGRDKSSKALHDVSLIANPNDSSNDAEHILNMIVEAPRWTNAQMILSPGEPFAPIRQALRRGGRVAYVRNTFPHRGYIWNYGAIPQTWADGAPVHACEIGQRVAQVGEVRRVRTLGLLAPRDEGVLRWTLLVIDTADPLAARINNIDDVERECPGLISATREWLRLYKLADGKPENTLDFAGEVKGIQFAGDILRTAHQTWRDIVTNQSFDALVDLTNITIGNSPGRVEDGVDIPSKEGFPGMPARVPSSVSKWWYLGLA